MNNLNKIRCQFYNQASHELILIFRLSDQNYMHYQEEIKVLTGMINWSEFISLLSRHRLISLLQILIENFELDKTRFEKLKKILLNDRMNQLKRLNEVNKLAEIIQKKEIVHLFIKGHILGALLYNNPSNRFSVDIDLVCLKKDLHQIDRTLINNGYEKISKSNWWTKLFWITRKDIKFLNPENKILTEIHYRLLPDITSRKFSSEVFLRGVKVKINNNQFHTLDLIDHYLFVLAHGSIHQYFRLFWLRDSLWFTKKFHKNDWDEINRRANEYALEKILYYNLSLLAVLFDYTPEINIKNPNNYNRLINTTLEFISSPVKETFSKRIKRLHFLIRLKNSIIYKYYTILSGSLRFLTKADR